MHRQRRGSISRVGLFFVSNFCLNGTSSSGKGKVSIRRRLLMWNLTNEYSWDKVWLGYWDTLSVSQSKLTFTFRLRVEFPQLKTLEPEFGLGNSGFMVPCYNPLTLKYSVFPYFSCYQGDHLMKSTMDCITINYVLYQKESQIIESSLRTRMRCETIHGHLTSEALIIDWNNACSESSVTGQRYDVYLNI